MSILRKVFEELRTFGVKAELSVPLRSYTTYRVGGSAELLLMPRTIEEFITVVDYIRSHKLPFRILGNGSNLLVNDDGVEGVVIATGKLRKKRVTYRSKSYCTVFIEAGTLINDFILWSARRGLKGYQRLFGIPASVGGAINNHLTSFGCSIAEHLDRVLILTPKGTEILKVKPDMFYYRGSKFKDERNIILGGWFKLPEAESPDEAYRTAYDYLHQRRLSQPLEYPSAGCVFKNPNPELKAWLLIDSVGLRGYRLGDAKISEKHANFIVNLGNAKASDIKTIIDEVKCRVKERFGITLQEEVEYW